MEHRGNNQPHGQGPPPPIRRNVTNTNQHPKPPKPPTKKKKEAFESTQRMKTFVSNLPDTLTPKQIEALTQTISSFCRVEDLKLATYTNGKCRGFARAKFRPLPGQTFSTKDEFVDYLNSFNLMVKSKRVKFEKFVYSKKKLSREEESQAHLRVCVLDIPKEMTDLDLEAQMKVFGGIKKCYIKRKRDKHYNHGFVTFNRIQASQRALEAGRVDFGLPSGEFVTLLIRTFTSKKTGRKPGVSKLQPVQEVDESLEEGMEPVRGLGRSRVVEEDPEVLEWRLRSRGIGHNLHNQRYQERGYYRGTNESHRGNQSYRRLPAPERPPRPPQQREVEYYGHQNTAPDYQNQGWVESRQRNIYHQESFSEDSSSPHEEPDSPENQNPSWIASEQSNHLASGLGVMSHSERPRVRQRVAAQLFESRSREKRQGRGGRHPSSNFYGVDHRNLFESEIDSKSLDSVKNVQKVINSISRLRRSRNHRRGNLRFQKNKF